MVKTLKIAAVLVAAMLVPAASQAANQYVGGNKCKSCHKDIYEQVKDGPHAKAQEALATDAAKKINKDAATDAKCLKCHDTGAALAADAKAKTFKDGQGVGCESCHGPGQAHVKARMAAEDGAPVADTEIVKKPTEKTCTTCHNKESPTFKGFKFAEAAKKIEHKKGKK